MCATYNILHSEQGDWEVSLHLVLPRSQVKASFADEEWDVSPRPNGGQEHCDEENPS